MPSSTPIHGFVSFSSSFRSRAGRLARRSAAVGACFGFACALTAQSPQPAAIDVPWDDSLPPGTSEHVERALALSSRHGEWVHIPLADGTPLESWVVYPERPDRAPVVLVIHDIRGLSDWARAVADQLAQDGFIAIAPDFLSGKGPDGGGTAALGNGVGQAIRALAREDVVARLDAAMNYGRELPAANGKTGVLGFCWGGTQSFEYAISQPELGASVVFYGSVPGATATSVPEDRLANVKAPIVGLFAGNDARINTTLPPTIAAMMKLNKTFEYHTFEASGHGFTSRQAGMDGANLSATRHAWPLALTFLRRHLEK
ncbi:dienelactone hydrolase family protein [Congregicoccus parvus]|uniref:dienelactone hydrolase family protein n=1 Tax=Congregicoccus parvus TaxID=3081749 RepID=UPI003FA5AB13